MSAFFIYAMRNTTYQVRAESVVQHYGIKKLLGMSNPEAPTTGVVLIAVRDRYGKGRGQYNDMILVTVYKGGLVVDHDVFKANTDPSRYRGGHGEGSSKGMAMLTEGLWSFERGLHKGKPAFRQHLEFSVWRDGDGSMSNKPYLDKGYFGINLHQGGTRTTGSEGCQTLDPSRWGAFFEMVDGWLIKLGISTFPYILMSVSDFNRISEPESEILSRSLSMDDVALPDPDTSALPDPDISALPNPDITALPIPSMTVPPMTIPPMTVPPMTVPPVRRPSRLTWMGLATILIGLADTVFNAYASGGRDAALAALVSNVWLLLGGGMMATGGSAFVVSRETTDGGRVGLMRAIFKAVRDILNERRKELPPKMRKGEE